MHSEPSQPHISLDPDARARVAAWVGEHWDAVFGLLFRVAGNRHEAEDLVQETFLRASRQFATFQPGTNVRAWLMRIAVNAHVDKRRREKVGRTEPLVDETSEVEISPLARAAGKELSEALEAALLELSETARIVFLLRTREDLSFADIAGAIETSEETARWHMLQARRRLLKLLEPWL